jgi:hypothetical protein
VLESAQVVLASGEIVRCSASENEDLFWAIRGAGSNFGPVTEFVFKAFPQTNNVWSGLVRYLTALVIFHIDIFVQLVFPPPKLNELFAAAATWAETAGPDESAMIFFACPPPAFQPCLVVIPFYNGSVAEAKEKFSAFYGVGPVADMTQEMPYAALNGIQNPMATHGDRKLFKASAFTSFEASRFQRLFDEYGQLVKEHPETGGSAIIIELHPYDKVVEVPTSATAFANRGKWYNINYSLRWKDAALDEKVRSPRPSDPMIFLCSSFPQLRTWSRTQVNYLRGEEAKGGQDLAGTRAYANYGLGDERVRDVFGENYPRLQQLKARYDPNNVFHKWFPITPGASA